MTLLEELETLDSAYDLLIEKSDIMLEEPQLYTQDDFNIVNSKMDEVSKKFNKLVKELIILLKCDGKDFNDWMNEDKPEENKCVWTDLLMED
jgi:hypothetical protein